MRATVPFLLALVACDPGDDPGTSSVPTEPQTLVDSGIEPVDTGVGLCAEAPVTTWANFGEGFLIEHCNACHRSTATDRQGAPAEVTFDTEEEAWAWADRILARAGGDEPTMPPQGGVDVDRRTLLEIWLTCDAG